MPAAFVGQEQSAKEFKKAARLAARFLLPQVVALLVPGEEAASIEFKVLAVKAIKDVSTSTVTMVVSDDARRVGDMFVFVCWCTGGQVAPPRGDGESSGSAAYPGSSRPRNRLPGM